MIVGPAIIGDECTIRSGAQVKSGSVIGHHVEIGQNCQISHSIVYENTLIGPKSMLDNCIIGENCQIGSESIVSNDVVVGPHCTIGNRVKLQPSTRIWPRIELKSGSVIRGIIRSEQD